MDEQLSIKSPTSRKLKWQIAANGKLLLLLGNFISLINMPQLKWLKSKFNGNDKYHAFPLLEELHITKLKALKDWFEVGVVVEDGGLFPCLIELVLRDYLILKELPSLPSKLKTLEIYKIGWTTLNFCSNSDYIPLEIIQIQGRTCQGS
ncbi:hypothetical protein IEQ34_004422 [Dendrobium chrysotoxum]|uniref:Uncharacterized protein n=1 Tax=Dendrobium chrysotoxum TaxID=161865 RepID=A0AAV7HGH7_DENCH|nr:hypothetical protein IEQ34_004422 [Dendrobium chrysotoxum]